MLITRKPILLSDFLSIPPDPSCGASSFFVGRVRNHHQGKAVRRLFYECYEEMAEKRIRENADKSKQTFKLESIRILHRIGWLEIGDIAVVIEASAAHRDETFKACRAVIEAIKREVPIWKREIYADGTDEWTTCSHLQGVHP